MRLSAADPDFLRGVGGIVLGGGRGTRLYPLTKVRAKPAVPLCGRYRLVDIPLSNCLHSGINRIVVLTQFNSHSLNRHIKNTYKFDEFSGGSVEILAAEQTNETGDWFQGTADAVRKHLIHIFQRGLTHLVVLSGDQLYRMDYRQMLDTLLRKDADLVVSALPVTRQAAQAFGIMRVNRSGRIIQFVEKPKEVGVLDRLVTPAGVFRDFNLSVTEGKEYLASMGVYAFRAEVLRSLLEDHPEWVDFGKELIPGALSRYRVYAHMFNGFWEDIGTVRFYFDVSMAMTGPNHPFELHDPRHMIYTHARMLPGVKIQRSRIENAIICSGTRIDDAEVRDSIIGVRSIIGTGARLHRAIVLGADYFESPEEVPEGMPPIGIGPGCRIQQAIIDHNARIGANVVIRGRDDLKDQDGDGWAIRDGIVVVFKDAVIPEGARIG